MAHVEVDPGRFAPYSLHGFFIHAFIPHGSTHPGLAAPDGPGADGAGLLVPAQDLGDAAVRDSELSRDDAGPDPVVGHLHDLVSDVVGQRAPVDEHSAELVDATLAQRSGHCSVTHNTGLLTGTKLN